MANKTDLLTTGSWQGRPCFVVGGGPSLLGFDFNRLKGSLTIGVNRAFEFFSPTVLLAIDARFFRWVYDGKYGADALLKIIAYDGIKVGIRISDPHVPDVREVRALGVSGPVVPIEQGVYHGNNSGYSAVALALALGADPVYLLGVDLRYDGERSHFHDGHPERTKERELYRKCFAPFLALAGTPEGRRVKVVNLDGTRPPFSHLAECFDVVGFPRSPGGRPIARLFRNIKKSWRLA